MTIRVWTGKRFSSRRPSSIYIEQGGKLFALVHFDSRAEALKVAIIWRKLFKCGGIDSF